MDVVGEFRLPAEPTQVWLRLTDPQILARCIPGCRRMSRLDAENYECEIRIRFGPIKADFLALLALSNVRAPASYTLTGRSLGGLADAGEGVADVYLLAAAHGTTLRYAARVSARGRVGRIGSPVLRAVTQHLMERFFAEFAATFDEVGADRSD